VDAVLCVASSPTSRREQDCCCAGLLGILGRVTSERRRQHLDRAAWSSSSLAKLVAPPLRTTTRCFGVFDAHLQQRRHVPKRIVSHFRRSAATAY
jgi:hypothetical protein